MRSLVPAAFVALGLFLASTRSARADGAPAPKKGGDDTPLLIYAGINAGADFLGKSNTGSALGLQASTTWITKTDLDTMVGFAGYGLYVDAAYLTNRDAARFSLGPQAAYMLGPLLFGVQPGMMTAIDHGKTIVGTSVTPAVSSILFIGAVWIYFRWDHEFAGDYPNTYQFGAIVQFPWNLLWEIH
jgi:hypothetical protein